MWRGGTFVPSLLLSFVLFERRSELIEGLIVTPARGLMMLGRRYDALADETE